MEKFSLRKSRQGPAVFEHLHPTSHPSPAWRRLPSRWVQPTSHQKVPGVTGHPGGAHQTQATPRSSQPGQHRCGTDTEMTPHTGTAGGCDPSHTWAHAPENEHVCMQDSVPPNSQGGETSQVCMTWWMDENTVCAHWNKRSEVLAWAGEGQARAVAGGGCRAPWW